MAKKGGLGKGMGELFGIPPAVQGIDKGKTGQHKPLVVEGQNFAEGDSFYSYAQEHSATCYSEEEMSLSYSEDGGKDEVKVIDPSTLTPAEVKQITGSIPPVMVDTMQGFIEVDINSVVPNNKQPRTIFKEEELEELAASIASDGLLQPIVVRPLSQGKYQIVAGERRWQASKKAGLKRIPVRIIEANDEKSLLLAIVENVQRSDLNPIEEAYGYKRLMEMSGMTQAEVAKAVSKARPSIANALRLLNLPENAQQLLYEGVITPGHANAILSVPTEEGRQKLIEKLKSEPTPSVREAESLARLLSGKVTPGAVEKVPLPQSFKRTAKSLKSYLGVPVKVKSSNGKNKIEIEFKDEEELERLFALIKKD